MHSSLCERREQCGNITLEGSGIIQSDEADAWNPWNTVSERLSRSPEQAAQPVATSSILSV